MTVGNRATEIITAKSSSFHCVAHTVDSVFWQTGILLTFRQKDQRFYITYKNHSKLLSHVLTVLAKKKKKKNHNQALIVENPLFQHCSILSQNVHC